MKVLLDTCTVPWIALDAPELTETARATLRSMALLAPDPAIEQYPARVVW